MDQVQIDRWEKSGIPKWFVLQLREVLSEEFGFSRGQETEKVLGGLIKGNKMDDETWLRALKEVVPEYVLEIDEEGGLKLIRYLSTGIMGHSSSTRSIHSLRELAEIAVERYSAAPELAEALVRFLPEELIRDVALADISGEFNPKLRKYTYKAKKEFTRAEKA